mgnify:FL=1
MQISKYTKLQIMLENVYNSGHDYPDKLNDSLNDMISIFNQLFISACILAAFQFIGILFNNSNDSSIFHILFGVGFILSLFSSVITFIISTFIKSLRYENMDFIKYILNKYSKIFSFGYITFFLNVIFFMISVNIILYDIINFYYAITINVLSVIITIINIIIYILLIHRKQSFIKDMIEYKRNIYYL